MSSYTTLYGGGEKDDHEVYYDSLEDEYVFYQLSPEARRTTTRWRIVGGSMAFRLEVSRAHLDAQGPHAITKILRAARFPKADEVGAKVETHLLKRRRADEAT